MSGFVGADVQQLRRLAGALDQAATRLESSASTVDASVHRSVAWHGPAADRFRSRWAATDRPRLLAAARQLHDAARLVRANADDQERASAGGPGSVSGPTGQLHAGRTASSAAPSAPHGSSGVDPLVEAEAVERAASVGIDFASTAGTIASIIKGFPIEPFPGSWVLGSVQAGFAVMHDIENDDAAQAWVDGGLGAVQTGLGVAGIGATGTVALGLPVIGLGVAAFGGLVHAGMPLTHSDLDAFKSHVLRAEFGASVDVENLTPQQAQWYVDRYANGFGPAVMISDQMDTVAEQVANAFGIKDPKIRN